MLRPEFQDLEGGPKNVPFLGVPLARSEEVVGYFHNVASGANAVAHRPQRVASVKMSHSTRTSIDRLNEPFDLGSSLLYFPVVLPQSFYSKGGLGLEINFFCLTAPETQSVVINSYTTIYLVTFCISFHSHDEKPQLIPYHEPTSVSTHETRPIKAYHKVTGGGRFCSSNLVRPK